MRSVFARPYHEWQDATRPAEQTEKAATLQKRVVEFDHGKVVRDEQEGRYGGEEPVWAPSGRDWHLRTLLRGDT